MLNEFLFKNLKVDRPWTLATYQASGGYEVWRKMLAEKTPPEAMIEDLKKTALGGRRGRASRAGAQGGVRRRAARQEHPRRGRGLRSLYASGRGRLHLRRGDGAAGIHRGQKGACALQAAGSGG